MCIINEVETNIKKMKVYSVLSEYKPGKYKSIRLKTRHVIGKTEKSKRVKGRTGLEYTPGFHSFTNKKSAIALAKGEKKNCPSKTLHVMEVVAEEIYLKGVQNLSSFGLWRWDDPVLYHKDLNVVVSKYRTLKKIIRTF